MTEAIYRQQQQQQCVSMLCMLSGFSRVLLCEMLWTVTCQAPLSMGFSREESWSGLPCPFPKDMSVPIPQFIPPSSSPLGVHTFVLYICVSVSTVHSFTPFLCWARFNFFQRAFPRSLRLGGCRVCRVRLECKERGSRAQNIVMFLWSWNVWFSDSHVLLKIVLADAVLRLLFPSASVPPPASGQMLVADSWGCMHATLL